MSGDRAYPSVYTISMLVTLNSRDYIRGYTSHPSQLHESIPIGRMSKTTTQTTRRDLEHPVDSNPEHSGGLVIKIETTTTNYSEVDQTNYQFDTKR
ncbi:hypothetical protein VNI00_010150 [Paramarasmius palmivorus]|uniref:Uncharacterized protein n=1 Tax=Paramarasmius palmivorus TaxID=297713 RepID=A0AAW0CGK7_9AGAR